MNHIKLFIVLFALTCLIGCKADKKNKPVVVSTIGMIHNIVEVIAQDKVTAIGLMGPGIDPHLYKASAGDVNTLSSADLIFYNGLHLESKMVDIFEKMAKKIKTVQVSKNIPENKLFSPPEFAGFHDPHIWFDVTLWKIVVTEITNALIELTPKHKKFYLKNHSDYQKKLDQLHQWVTQQVKTIPKERRILVTAHDAFGYFGRAYNITVVGLQGISTASEAGTKDIQHVTNIIIEHKVPTIFIESSVPVRQIQAVQAAVQSKGWTVAIGEELFTDAMGDAGTAEGSYIGMIKHNVNSIVHGLK